MEAESRDLVLIDRARQALAEAQSLGEVVELPDQAAAMAVYLKRRDGAEQAASQALEIRVRAERKIGEMLRNRKKHKGGRPNPLHPATGLPETLEELGIERTRAMRWQQIAAIPEEIFEAEVTKKSESGELSTGGVVRFARQLRAEAKRDHELFEAEAVRQKRWGSVHDPTPEQLEEARRSHLEHQARIEAERKEEQRRHEPVTALASRWTEFHNEFHRSVNLAESAQEYDDLRTLLCDMQDSLVVFEEMFREADQRFGVDPKTVLIREQERQRSADQIRFEAQAP